MNPIILNMNRGCVRAARNRAGVFFILLMGTMAPVMEGRGETVFRAKSESATKQDAVSFSELARQEALSPPPPARTVKPLRRIPKSAQNLPVPLEGIQSGRQSVSAPAAAAPLNESAGGPLPPSPSPAAS